MSTFARMEFQWYSYLCIVERSENKTKYLISTCIAKSDIQGNSQVIQWRLDNICLSTNPTFLMFSYQIGKTKQVFNVSFTRWFFKLFLFISSSSNTCNSSSQGELFHANNKHGIIDGFSVNKWLDS